MDSRPGPVRHCRSCRSCVSYVYVFSKKITWMDVVHCTGKRTSRKLAEKEVFCRHPEMLSEIVVFGSWQPC